MLVTLLGPTVVLLSLTAHAASEALSTLLAKALAWFDCTPSLTVTVAIATSPWVVLPCVTEAVADIVAANLAPEKAVAGFRVARGPLTAVAIPVIPSQRGGGEAHPGRPEDYAIGALMNISVGSSEIRGCGGEGDRTCSIA